MSNESYVKGEGNVVIQGVTNSKITVKVNGTDKEIKNDLKELKALLSANKATTFKAANVSYQIDHLNENNFGLIVGKRFNEHLTKVLVESLQQHKKGITKWLKANAKGDPHWERKAEVCNVAKDIIMRSYVGVVGLELRKLIAIGSEDFSGIKMQKFIKQCFRSIKRGLQLVCIVFISKLWDEVKENKIKLDKKDLPVLDKFFTQGHGLTTKEFAALLHELLTFYNQQQLELPIAELKKFDAKFDDKSDFKKACIALGNMEESFDGSQASLLACSEAERHLTVFLSEFSFLANYKMVSIKSILYDELRNRPPRYQHKFTILGVFGARKVNTAQAKALKDPVSSDGILFFTGKFEKIVNLFPFVIDINALAFEEGAKVSFYKCRGGRPKSLAYEFVFDNKELDIEFADVLKKYNNEFDKVLMDEEDLKIAKLDDVYIHLEEAKDDLVGQSNSYAVSDIFSDDVI